MSDSLYSIYCSMIRRLKERIQKHFESVETRIGSSCFLNNIWEYHGEHYKTLCSDGTKNYQLQHASRAKYGQKEAKK